MKRLHLPIACLLGVSFFISCNSNEGEESVSLPTETTPTSLSPLKATDTFKPAKPAGINPTTVTTALNPAHGQPGHRCEIAVGAPLTSAPSATIPPVQMQRPTQLASPMQANPNNPNISAKPAVISQAPTTAGLNPAHGQPGHRCEIAVGAPLTSAPATSSPVQVQSPVQAASPVMVIPKNTGGIKLNPAHGQPGHDCAVEVGKPLKQ